MGYIAMLIHVWLQSASLKNGERIQEADTETQAILPDRGGHVDPGL